MSQISQEKVREGFSRHLLPEEKLVCIGALQKVPTTSYLLLTKGLAWFFSQQFYVAVTDRRLMILPASSVKHYQNNREDVIFLNFDEVEFTTLLSNIILNVELIHKGSPLKLRFRSGFKFNGLDQFDFIAAVKQGKQS
jgi:hypothetical protein